MLKVVDNLVALNANPPSRKSGAGEQNFASYLEAAVDQNQNITQTSAVEKTSLTTSNADPTDQVVDALNEMLETMDRLASALADPSRTLKEIEPLVNKLESMSGSLGAGGQGAQTASDDELREIITETVSQVQAEVLKFRRGDYA